MGRGTGSQRLVGVTKASYACWMYVPSALGKRVPPLVILFGGFRDVLQRHTSVKRSKARKDRVKDG